MVLTDHLGLQKATTAATQTVQLEAISSGSMSVADHAELLKLKVLSGKAFDEAYIKGLVRGNEEIQKEEKAEASGSAIASVKKLAERGATLDTKHADKAKQLAQAHHIQP